jgi:transposase
MDVMVQRCAAIDVAKKELAVTVRVPAAGSGRVKRIRRMFGTTSRQLLALLDFLLEHQVSLIGMESTGDYWKPVYYVLEGSFDHDQIWLLNPRHMKAVPGRKTDMSDADWICDLLAYGLVRPSFVPPAPIRRLRDLTRRRTLLLRDATREKQRLEKTLEDAGIKLGTVASDILGASGRAMIEALIGGQRDGHVLAEMALRPMRKKRPALAEALVGRFDEHHAFICQQILTHLDMIDYQVADLDLRIIAELAPYADKITLLDTIPGVDTRAAEVILAEIGPDMRQFPTAGHLASWAGLCPGNNRSGGRSKSSRTRHGDRWLRGVLGNAARSLSRTHSTYLAAQFKRIAAKRGGKRAIVAVSHSILASAWHMLDQNVAYHDLGPDFFLNHQDPDKRRNRLVGNLEAMGFQVTLTPTDQPNAA